MTNIIPFPPRGPFTVSVCTSSDGWLVVCRSHGWVHPDKREAISDAEFIASTFGVAVTVVS
jgi:hypothetical protein